MCWGSFAIGIIVGPLGLLFCYALVGLITYLREGSGMIG